MPTLALSVTGVADGGGPSAWTLGTNFPCSNGPDPSGAASNTLAVSFSGTLPTTAIITGWTASVSRDASAGGDIYDASITATVGGKGLNDKADTGTLWPLTTATATYGGDTDTWGDTAPTATQFNSLGGSVGIAVKTDNVSPGLAYVRDVGLVITYNDPGSIQPESATGGEFAVVVAITPVFSADDTGATGASFVPTPVPIAFTGTDGGAGDEAAIGITGTVYTVEPGMAPDPAMLAVTQFAPGDAATGGEFTANSLYLPLNVDAAAGGELTGAVGLLVSDSATAAESFISITLTVGPGFDGATGAEATGAVGVTATDSGAGAEPSPVLAASLFRVESGAAAEWTLNAATLFIATGSAGGDFLGALANTLVGTDGASGSAGLWLSPSVFAGDSGTGAAYDASTAALLATGAATGSDGAFLGLAWVLTDGGAGAATETLAAALRPTADGGVGSSYAASTATLYGSDAAVGAAYAAYLLNWLVLDSGTGAATVGGLAAASTATDAGMGGTASLLTYGFIATEAATGAALNLYAATLTALDAAAGQVFVTAVQPAFAADSGAAADALNTVVQARADALPEHGIVVVLPDT